MSFNKTPTNIPPLLGKLIKLVDLKNKSYNGKTGLLVEWCEERKRFGVKLAGVGSIKWIKPMNLGRVLLFKSGPEQELKRCISEKKFPDFEHGLKLFDKIEDSYVKFLVKIKWLDGQKNNGLKDKRCLPKIIDVARKIINNCPFDDLVVQAKSLLFTCLLFQDQNKRFNEECKHLAMSCINHHYGQLPTVFDMLLNTFDYIAELRQGNYENWYKIKNVYEEAKNAVENGLCLCGQQEVFANATLFFLDIGKKYNLLANNYVFEECANVRKIWESTTFHRRDDPHHHNLVAQLHFLEENYEKCLEETNKFEKILNSKFGSSDGLGRIYSMKVLCYIALKNAKMAKKALKKYKTFGSSYISHHNIKDWTYEIKKIPKNTTTKKEKIRVGRVKCSNYTCEKIEPEVGTFKVCSRCEQKYYCSIKCHKQHWKKGHKDECKPLRKK